MLANKLMSALSGAEDKPYVNDVFSAYTRTGTSDDVTVPTGIDMTKGYMLWSKERSGASDHAIYDSARGLTYDLASNLNSAQIVEANGLKAVSTTGYTVGRLPRMNTRGAAYVDWVFRKAPKFFDVVTYTGNGASKRAIAHLLGQEVGIVITKTTSGIGDWNTYHRSATGDLALNTTARQTGNKALVNSATISTFTVSGNANIVGRQYVAYLFAHDPSADGIIRCGSYTGNGTLQTINCGFTTGAGFILIKRSDAIGNWYVWDTARGIVLANDPSLSLNTNAAENTTDDSVDPYVSGFIVNAAAATNINVSGGQYIFLAIA